IFTAGYGSKQRLLCVQKGNVPDIGTLPKNALVRQYQTYFALENVQLQFTDGALRAIAYAAVRRTTGARGLRVIMEEILTRHDVRRTLADGCTGMHGDRGRCASGDGTPASGAAL